MNIAHRLSELERVQMGMFYVGHIESYNEQINQVTVKIDVDHEQQITSAAIPLIGRSSAVIGEPIFLILPAANPSLGYAFPISADPRIEELTTRVTNLENA